MIKLNKFFNIFVEFSLIFLYSVFILPWHGKFKASLVSILLLENLQYVIDLNNKQIKNVILWMVFEEIVNLSLSFVLFFNSF